MLAKRSPLKKHINKAILHLQENGLSSKWTLLAFGHMRSHFRSNKASTAEPKSHHLGLTFFQLHSIYYFWSFGLTLSCCLLLLEIAYEKWSLRRVEFPPLVRNAATAVHKPSFSAPVPLSSGKFQTYPFQNKKQ